MSRSARVGPGRAERRVVLYRITHTSRPFLALIIYPPPLSIPLPQTPRHSVFGDGIYFSCLFVKYFDWGPPTPARTQIKLSDINKKFPRSSRLNWRRLRELRLFRFRVLIFFSLHSAAFMNKGSVSFNWPEVQLIGATLRGTTVALPLCSGGSWP